MKKLFTIFLTAVLMLSLFSPAVYASENDVQTVIESVNKTNEKIDKMINNAIEKVNKETIKYTNDLEKSNGKEDKIKELEEDYNYKVNKIIFDLIKDTNKIAANTKEKAAEKGIEVTCELVEVHIGGQIVWIDPLIVGAY
ncbi:hypothetical protein [Clostridium grantii]|uniref:Uncharacterized protein n=1 Tax=Clostridium grantii DSM 8605 TaxID=1121316 RepID=A0A1M5VTM9_9CLOT|nr:hypothetical protein [Clostridium grantii]SHH78567.1 hypothetical protein SAMN02745207_02478 [Clostridium grantii DSM 8605]